MAAAMLPANTPAYEPEEMVIELRDQGPGQIAIYVNSIGVLTLSEEGLMFFPYDERTNLASMGEGEEYALAKSKEEEDVYASV